MYTFYVYITRFKPYTYREPYNLIYIYIQLFAKIQKKKTVNGKPQRRIRESPKGAPECIGNRGTINSFVKNLQLKNKYKVAKNAIQRVRCVYYT